MGTPVEQDKKEFSKVLKGYAPTEVDEYIAQQRKQYAALLNECKQLEMKYKAALVKLDEAKNEESTISSTIINAQKMADAIISQANDKAKAVTDSVNESCDRILNAYKEKVIAERNKLAKTEQMAMDFKESLYAAYKEHIDAIDKILPDENQEDSISSATDEELVDSALDLAKEKYQQEADDFELAPMGNDEKSAE